MPHLGREYWTPIVSQITLILSVDVALTKFMRHQLDEPCIEEDACANAVEYAVRDEGGC